MSAGFGKAKSSFLKRRPQMGGDMSLNITAMADIFTVLLVFLLKSYATGAVAITPSAQTQLPIGVGQDQAVEALKLEVSSTAILVEGQPIVSLKAYQFDGAELQGNGTLKSLTAALEKERKRQLLIAQNNADVKVDARVIVVADQKVPYSTLKSVLASAAVQGYTDFKLAVVRKD